jgi:hypothetical protein
VRHNFWPGNGQPGGYRFVLLISTDKRACVYKYRVNSRIVGNPETSCKSQIKRTYNTTVREQTYTKWCCIDLSNAPRLPGSSLESLPASANCSRTEDQGSPRSFGLRPSAKNWPNLVILKSSFRCWFKLISFN